MSNDTNDKEIAAITAVNAALSGLEDQEAKERVISYVLARHWPDRGSALSKEVRANDKVKTLIPTKAGFASKEIAGVAQLTDGGELRITVRDLKARSKLDAAVRMAHIAIYANEHLAGAALSSRAGLTPILKHHRLYDGNTRNRLAKEKGLVRDGDNLTLDAHAKNAAERFIEEALDGSIEGKWKPE